METAFNRRKNYSCWIWFCNFTYRQRYSECLSLWRTVASDTLYLVLQHLLQSCMTHAALTLQKTNQWKCEILFKEHCKSVPQDTANVLNFRCNSYGIVYYQQYLKSHIGLVRLQIFFFCLVFLRQRIVYNNTKTAERIKPAHLEVLGILGTYDQNHFLNISFLTSALWSLFFTNKEMKSWLRYHQIAAFPLWLI